MPGWLWALLSFLLALGVLVTVHEFGHYWVAKRLGVKVLRFSVGFGRPLWRKVAGADRTEFVIAALPLGGYVKMLDEREGAVAPAERDRAFNRMPLATRSAVVVAGPALNFLFAIVAYWLMFMVGVTGMVPMVGDVTSGSHAERAGFVSGDRIVAIDGRATPTWDTALTALLDGALAQRPIEVQVQDVHKVDSTRILDLNGQSGLEDEAGLLQNIGLSVYRPTFPAVIDKLEPGGAAERAGLQAGDEVIAADGQAIDHWEQWVDWVRARPGERIAVTVVRDGAELDLELRPERIEAGGEPIGRIGAYGRVPADLYAGLQGEVRYGPVAGLGHAVIKTGEMSLLTLRVLWKMLVGEASVKNLSGPLSIASYAGHSASIGLAAFLAFLAVVSISLGVLNLLPIPLLDGGHLLYYLIELVKGSPVSERTQELGQTIGMALLLGLMGLAFYNDLSRLFG